ncbi:MAG TPA: hypothetical protein ENH37_02700 [Deltaproteobacteria bacterium]|nr:hypothetical protein [Deltaproteobacteria bacterium]
MTARPETMTRPGRRRIFNILGGGIVVLWLIMIGLLIKKSYFTSETRHPEISSAEIPSFKGSRNDWMEIFLKDQKIGYSTTRTTPLGEDCLIQEEVVLNLNLMGQTSLVRTSTRAIVDRRFRLKSFLFRIDSGVVSFRISGRVEGERMRLEVGEGKGKKVHFLMLSGSPVTGSGMTQFFRGRPLKTGESFRFFLFDPSTMAQTPVVVKVAARESLTINRIRYNAYRLETELWGQDLLFWLDEKGEVLKEKGFMGLTLIRSNAATAPRDLGRGGVVDFYQMASIDVEPKLMDPYRLIYLRLKVEGLKDIPFDQGILSRGRQRFRNGVLEVTVEKTPLRADYTTPFKDPSEAMKPYLEPGPLIQSDQGPIRKKAEEIAGNRTDPPSVAATLMNWVYNNIQKRPVISVPSAVEVLKTRMGDCNEHAVLLTALLRAAGIPAREAVGLVYARGRFFYHAWTEAYLGEWVSMDATLNQMPTDATHIKLAQGGLGSQTDIMPLMGRLKLKVMDYGYDSTDRPDKDLQGP